MKKKILGIAAAIVAFVAINASAQNNATNYCNNNCNNNCTPEAQCQNPTKCKKDKKECRNPFAGLNLTDEQQKAIKEIKRPNCKAFSDSCKNIKAKKMQSARTEYLAKIKTILTPQQYQQFLKNNFVNGASKHKKHGFKNHHKGMKGDFKGKRPNNAK